MIEFSYFNIAELNHYFIPLRFAPGVGSPGVMEAILGDGRDLIPLALRSGVPAVKEGLLNLIRHRREAIPHRREAEDVGNSLLITDFVEGIEGSGESSRRLGYADGIGDHPRRPTAGVTSCR
jgi:hypothetical protein